MFCLCDLELSLIGLRFRILQINKKGKKGEEKNGRKKTPEHNQVKCNLKHILTTPNRPIKPDIIPIW